MEMRSTAYFIRKEIIEIGFGRLENEESYLDDWLNFYNELREDFLEFKQKYSNFTPSKDDFNERAECHHFSLEAEQIIHELKLKVPKGRLEILDEMENYFEEWKLQPFQ